MRLSLRNSAFLMSSKLQCYLPPSHLFGGPSSTRKELSPILLSIQWSKIMQEDVMRIPQGNHEPCQNWVLLLHQLPLGCACTIVVEPSLLKNYSAIKALLDQPNNIPEAMAHKALLTKETLDVEDCNPYGMLPLDHNIPHYQCHLQRITLSNYSPPLWHCLCPSPMNPQEYSIHLKMNLTPWRWNHSTHESACTMVLQLSGPWPATPCPHWRQPCAASGGI